MDDVILPQGRYLESVVLISLMEVYQEWVSRRGVFGGCLRFLSRDLEDMVIPDVTGDLFLPQGRYPESFVLISLVEVCQEWGVKKGSLGGFRGFLIGDMKDPCPP